MRKMTREVWSLQRSLVHKYELRHNDIALNQLRRVMWYSVPVVYPDYQRDMRIINAEWEKLRKRKGRWLKYVIEMSRTFDELYLVSLTFDDETLETTNFETRKKRVRDWLNANTVDYFACVDYGKVNNREHYHAIVSFAQTGVRAYYDDRIELHSEKHGKTAFYRLPEERAWPFGFYSIRAVPLDTSDTKRSAFYAMKSASYAFKNANDDNDTRPFHKRGVEHCSCDLLCEDQF